MTNSDKARWRLARAVTLRRQELGLSVRAAARLADIDRATWTALEEGTRATQDRHYAAIERTLQWAAGSIESILVGGDPMLLGARTPRYPPEIYEQVIRTDTERQIMAVRKQTETVRWGVIFGIREQAHDAEQSASGDQLRKEA